MKVLVTGRAGFLGSHIVDLLLQSDIWVTIFDNLITGLFSNINSAAVFLKKDIRDEDLTGFVARE